MMRCGNLRYDLTQIGEVISDAMFKSIVLSGLKKEFERYVTLGYFSEQEVDFDRMKRLILSFKSTHNNLIKMRQCSC